MTQQVWLITGCTSGIGEALAKAVLARGDLLIAIARAPIDRLADLKNAGASTLELDSAASQETIGAVVQEAVAIHGRIDVVVPNAGYLEAGFIEGLPLEAWEQQFAVNFFGVINLVKAVLPYMRKQKSGVIGFTNSVYSHMAVLGYAPYVVSKHATAGYAKTLSIEVGSLGIKVISFDIGFIQTPVFGAVKYHPSGIEDYAAAEEHGATLFQTMLGNMPGDVDRCAEAIINVTKSTKRSFTMAPIGADALLSIREYMKLVNDNCDELADVANSVESDKPRRGFWTQADHYMFLERPEKPS